MRYINVPSKTIDPFGSSSLLFVRDIYEGSSRLQPSTLVTPFDGTVP